MHKLTTLVRSYFRRKAMPFYSVARGRHTGVYTSWPECQAQVKSFSGAVFKKFNTKTEAEQHVLDHGGTFSADGLQPSAAMPIQKAATSGVSSSGSGSSSKSNTLKRARPDEPTESAANTDIDTKRPRTIGMKSYGRHSFLEDADGYVHVYTDGSCEGNGQKNAVAGLGVYFGEGHAL